MEITCPFCGNWEILSETTPRWHAQTFEWQGWDYVYVCSNCGTVFEIEYNEYDEYDDNDYY